MALHNNIFDYPVSVVPPPPQIPTRTDHPLAPVGLAGHALPVQTNKFHANLLLGDQDNPAYVLPYSVSWAKGRGPSQSWGLTVSHVDAEQRVFGPAGGGTCSHGAGTATASSPYFFSPPVVQNVVLSSADLGPDTALTLSQVTGMSVMVNLWPSLGMATLGTTASPAVQFPLVQGQGFVTAIYNGAVPVVSSAMAIFPEAPGLGAGSEPMLGQQRYVLKMNDGCTWVMYACRRPGTPALELYAATGSASTLMATGGFYGILQVAKVPRGTPSLAPFDQASGAYAVGVALSGACAGARGQYSFGYNVVEEGRRKSSGASGVLMYALPHHAASFDEATRRCLLPQLQLATPAKGEAVAVFSRVWTMVESELPVSMGFLPWDPCTRLTAGLPPLPANVRQLLVDVARQELAEDMEAQSDLDSMYFGGKALAKFATIVLCAHELLQERELAAAGLRKLQAAFARFSENRQRHPLVYDGVWGGVVSSAAYTTGDHMADFGNSLYNDHHFHYGYFVYAGAVLGHLDNAWLAAGPGHATYVDLLARDYASPSARDGFFPVSRSFDWFQGHSWAHGLFPSMDGKNQESSSEDVMAAYALKLWGRVRGDAAMEARGNLMLAVQARALACYYLYANDGPSVEPAAFAANRVAGILFENKLDHTTFFGGRPEYIHGIHMLPLLPCTPLCRPPAFVAQEWAAVFADKADQAEGGWRGVLYGNLATADARSAWRFFAQPGFDRGWIDGGASRTWYLCYTAALGGAV